MLIIWRDNGVNAVLVKARGEQVMPKNLLIYKAAIDGAARRAKKRIPQPLEKMFILNITCALVTTTFVVEKTKLSELSTKGIRGFEFIRESKKTGGTSPPGVPIRSDTVEPATNTVLLLSEYISSCFKEMLL